MKLCDLVELAELNSTFDTSILKIDHASSIGTSGICHRYAMSTMD